MAEGIVFPAGSSAAPIPSRIIARPATRSARARVRSEIVRWACVATVLLPT